SDRGSVEIGIDAAGLNDVRGIALRALAGDEEVRSVLDDRPTEGSTVLIAPIRRLGAAAKLLRFRLLVETLVAIELVRASLAVVRAGLGDDGQDAASGAAVLGLVLLRLAVELLHRLNVEVLQRAADSVVGVVTT